MLGGAFQDPKKETASVRLENEVALEHAQKPVELDRQWHGTKLETVLETRNDDLTREVKGASSDKKVLPETWEIREEDKAQGGGPRDPKRRRLFILCKETESEPKEEDVRPEYIADEMRSEREDVNRNPGDPKRRRPLRLRVKTKPERMDEVKQALDPKSASWLRGVKRKPSGRVNREGKRMPHDDDVPMSDQLTPIQKRKVIATARKKQVALIDTNDRTRYLYSEGQRQVLERGAFGPRPKSPHASPQAANFLTLPPAKYASLITPAPETSGGGSSVAVAPSSACKTQVKMAPQQSGSRGVLYNKRYNLWVVRSRGATRRLNTERSFYVAHYRRPDKSEEEACEAARQAAVACRMELVASGEAKVIHRQGKAAERVSGVIGVTWKRDQQRWVAYSHAAGNPFTKSFYPRARTEQAIEEARLAAVAYRAEWERRHLEFRVSL